MDDKKKKKTSDKVNTDLDFDDLSDLAESGVDFGDDLEEGPAREPARSKVVKELATDAGKGFFEALIKKTTKDALPEQYDASHYDALDIYNFAGEVVDRNKEKLNKTMFKLGKEAKRVLPFKLSMLDKFLENQQANFEAYKQQSEEEVRNAGIQSELSSIFDKQLEVQKAFEARREAKDDVDKKEQLVQAKLSTDIFANIDSNIARQTAFTVEISKQFYRKSLEIQFKTYFVQADMLRTMRDHYKAFSIQFTNIEKNTSLPEFVKLKNTERLQDILRTQATQSVYNQLFDNSKFVAGMKKRLSGFVDQKVDDITSKVDNFTDMIGNLTGSAEATGGSPVGLMASIASSMFGGAIGDKLASKISPKIKDKIKDNKAINTGANYLNMLSNSPSTLIQTLREKAARKEDELQDESSPGRWVGSKIAKGLGSLLDVASPLTPDTTVKQLGYLDHNKPAIFDNKVHRSITEVIPLFLARILKQNTDLTSMYHQVNSDKVTHPNSELLNYDFANRTLAGDSAIRSNVEKNVFGDKSTQKRSKSISSSILSESLSAIKKSDASMLDKKMKERSLSGSGSEKLLTMYIEEAKKHKTVDLSFDSLIANYDKNTTLQEIVAKKPELKDLLEILRGSKAKMPSFVDSGFRDLRNTYPLEGVKKLFSETSRLAKSLTPHTLTDEVATVFSKAFSTYILMTGRDVDTASVITKKAFAFMKETDLTEKVQNSLVVFLDDVKRIRNTDDSLLGSSLEVLFGLMNYSIKQNINIDPAAYQTLAELYPNFVKKGQLSIENIAEGKLAGQNDDNYVSFNTLADITKISKVELNDKRKEITTDNLLDKATRMASERLKRAAEALKQTNGNPVAVAELMVKSAKNLKTSVSDKMRDNFNDMQTSLTQAYSNMTTYGDNLIKQGIPKSISLINKCISNVDRRIELLKIDLSERLGEINRIGNDLSDITNQPAVSSTRLKQLDKTYTAYVESEIKALTNVKRILTHQNESLIRIHEEGNNIVTDTIKKVRGTMATTVFDLKQTLEELEAKGRALSFDNY